MLLIPGHFSRLLVSLSVCLSIGGNCYADPLRSSKRGLAFTNETPTDLATLQQHVAWWYNWALIPGDAVKDNYAQFGVEYVPMAWDSGFDAAYLRQYLAGHPQIRYLLTYNEPNFASQANMTPQQVADSWPQLEAIADQYQLKIVAPAVNYSPGDVDIPGTDDNGSPFAYLDAFFAACGNCRVDYIAIHGFMGSASALENYVQQFYQRYHKPIWLTEWNLSLGDNRETLEQQMDFLAETSRWLEQQDYVSRYAWLVGRSSQGADNAPYVDILTPSGGWTQLGALYQQIPSQDYYQPLPTTIEAEAAQTLSGFHHRATYDSQGQPVVQLFSDAPNNSAQLSYQVQSEHTQDYQLTLSYAAPDNAQLALKVDDGHWQPIFLPSSANPYVWLTQNTSVTIPAGNHQLSLRVDYGQPNLDWFRLE